ncbi:hypothetical protein M8C21_033308, partial [Ambrosia artemisiifolia]
MSATKSTSTTGVRIVVAGDRGTGKSSLIITAAAESFPTNVPPVLPPTRLPEDMFPEHVPVTVIDTSSSLENRGKLADELKRADAVVLTYACDEPSTLDRLSTFWLPELRRLEVKVPVIVAGCKLDLRDEQQAVSLELVMSPIMQQFREIETCIECSAYKHIQIPEVFYYAQKAVLHPTAPLFDQEAQTLKPRCVRALKRIFILCDHDRDGALSDAELNDFQVKCFNAPLQPSEIVGVKRVVQEKLPEGVNENGLTLTGFLFLHALFIEKGRLETTWTVLRKYGYNNDIRLGDDQLLPPIKRTPDQSVELTSEAVEFLRGVFTLFDSDGDGALNAHELEDLFSTAPESPWNEAPYANAAEKNALGGLSLDGFLSEWAFMTILDPVLSVENLIYIGQFSEVYTPTTEERYAVNTVDQPDVTEKLSLLVAKWTGQEVQMGLHGQEQQSYLFRLPVTGNLLVSQDMGIEAPIPISTKLGDFNNVFRRIVRAAEHPHLSIPETEAGKTRKQYHRVLNRSLMVVSVGAAVAIVGLAAY